MRTSDTGLCSNTGRQENQVRTSDTGLCSTTGTQGIQWGTSCTGVCSKPSVLHNVKAQALTLKSCTH